jgi:hypothetical protein
LVRAIVFKTRVSTLGYTNIFLTTVATGAGTAVATTGHNATFGIGVAATSLDAAVLAAVLGRFTRLTGAVATDSPCGTTIFGAVGLGFTRLTGAVATNRPG